MFIINNVSFFPQETMSNGNTENTFEEVFHEDNIGGEVDVDSRDSGDSESEGDSPYDYLVKNEEETAPENSKQFLTIMLTGLLPNNIPKATLQATDDLKQMLQSTVEKKIQLYAKNGKISVKTLQLSFPESYASKLKNDKLLIETIISPICQEINKIEELVLPEVSIETLHHLVVEKKLFQGIQKCLIIQIPFSAKNAQEIINLLPNIIKALIPLDPHTIECKPHSDSAKYIAFRTRSCTLKQKILEIISKNKPLTFYYDGTKVGKTNERKRPRAGSDHEISLKQKREKTSEKKLKPKKPRKLVPLPEKEETLFTFDSLEPQQDIVDYSFTATSYWQLQKIHTLVAGQGTTIAIVDSGIDPSHPAFTDGHMIDFRDFG